MVEESEEIRAVLKILSAGSDEEVQSTLFNLDEEQLCEVIIVSDHSQKARVAEILPLDKLSQVIPILEINIQQAIVSIMAVDQVIGLLELLSTEEATDILRELDEDYLRTILGRLPNALNKVVTNIVLYPERSAGRLISHNTVAVPEYLTIGNLIDWLRSSEHKVPEKFYQIIVVNNKGEPVGVLSLEKVLVTDKNLKIKDIMSTDMVLISPLMEEEEAARIFSQYSLLSAPVVNDEGKLIGVIIIDEITYVIQRNFEEDTLHLGLASENDFQLSFGRMIKSRVPWLFTSLLISVVLSFVIGLFDSTLEKYIELAILAPIIVSVGGNAGLQALTITIRAIATKQLTGANSTRVLLKELVLGITNGFIIALSAMVIVVWRFPGIGINAVFASAFVLTFTIGTFAGTAIPIIIHKLNGDPAVSSSVLISAVTDFLSFVSFLGLAKIFLI